MTKYYFKKILQDMATKLKPVCANVFVLNRPESIDGQMKEFIVVRPSYTMRSKGSFQLTNYKVEICIREKELGLANIAKMDKMINAVTALFPMYSSDGRYIAHEPYVSVGGSDGTGFTAFTMSGKITVNTTDKY